MANQINYKIGFDIEKNALGQLKNELKEIQNLTTSAYKANNPSMAGKSLKEASIELSRIKAEAAQIEDALNKAFNPTLGVANLTKFSQAIKSIGIDKLQQDFNSLGSVGTSAFRSLTTSLVTTNVQLKESHKLLNDMAISFKNTVKWGISSAAFNNMTNSLSKAWTYTKNLDKSLNNIRIVSGASADEMERFAQQANRAAQSLGSSTLDYTNASLIYYQQGLNEQEVIDRTNTTIKMANVLGESAKNVSDYMTAIWNNFDNGSKTLEYYGDVITALGAKTASSAEEIAGGLEKFASIGQTVGLSYEYATSALATIVAATRQSEDTVGTALKTIFARIQGLNLGDTLDDGTTLNKYSDALAKVGINIKDQNGQMKEMDKILDEMGKKWGTLSKDQQVALAQTVAGVRQYNQLLSLMENWDSFEKNVDIARGSLGTLQKQQEIYLDSTEAKMEKLGSATERLMSSFIDSKGMKSLITGLTGVVNLFANMVEGIGGGSNALLVLGSVGMQVFGNQIARSLNTTIVNMEAAKTAAIDLKTTLDNLGNIKMSNAYATDEVIQKITDSKARIMEVSSGMSQDEHDQVNTYMQKIQAELDLQTKMENDIQEAKANLIAFKSYSNEELAELEENAFAMDDDVEEFFTTSEIHIKEFKQLLSSTVDEFHSFQNSTLFQDWDFSDVNTELKLMSDSLQNFLNMFADVIEPSDKESLQEILGQLEKEREEYQKLQNSDNWETTNDSALSSLGKTNGIINNFRKQATDAMNTVEMKSKHTFNTLSKTAEKNYNKVMKASKKTLEKNTNDLDAYTKKLEDIKEIKAFTNMLAGIGQVAAGMQTLINLNNIWENDSLTTWEKTFQTVTALASTLPLLVNGFKTIKNGLGSLQKFMTGFAEGFGKGAGKIAESLTNNILTKSVQDETQAEIENAAVKTGVGSKATNKKIANNNLEIASNKAVEKSLSSTGGTATVSGAAVTEAGGAMSGAGAAAAEGSTGITALGESLGAVAIYALIVIAVIAALAAAIYFSLKAYNADKDAAEKAAQSAKEAAEAAQEAKNKYDQLVSSFDKYDQAVEKLKDMTEGTEEYKNAIQEANDAVMELIKSDNSLSKYVVRNTDGLLTFGNGKTAEEVKREAEATMRSARGAANLAQINANQKYLKSKTTNLRRDLNDEYSLRYEKKYSNPNYDSSTQPSSERYIANAPERKMLTNDQISQITELISKNNGSLIKADLEKLDFLTEDMIDILMSSNDGLLQLTKVTEDLTATNKLLLDESLRDSLEKNDEEFRNKTDAQKGAITKLYGKGLTEEETKKMRKNLEKEWYQDKAFGLGNEDTVHEEYAKLRGWSISADHWGDTATYVDENGDTHKIDDDSAREYIINRKLQDKISDYDTKTKKKISKAVSKVDTSALDKQYGTKIGDTVLNNIAAGNKTLDFSSLYDSLSPDEVKKLGAMTASEWSAALGLKPEDFKTLGLKSAENFKKQFDSSMKDYKWDANKQVERVLGGDENKDKLAGYDLDQEEIKGYTKYLMQTADESDDLADSLEHDAEASAIVSKSIMRMNNGIDKLADGFEDWSDVLKKSSKSSKEYYDALSKMQDAVADLLDTEDEYVTDSFIQGHFEDIKKAAEGNSEAIEKLHRELAKDIAINIATNNNGSIIDGKQIDIDIKALETKLKGIEIPDVEVGTSMNFEKMDSDMQTFTKKMMDIVNNAHMTAEEANEFFGQMGFEAKFDTKKATVTRSVPVEETKSEITSLFPLEMTSRTYQIGTESVTQEVDVPAMTTDGSDPKVNLTKKAGGNFNNYSSKNKGGPGPGSNKGNSSKPDKMERVKDDKDRYHKVNTQLAIVDKNLKKLESQEEKTFGTKLVDNLNKQLKLYNRQIDLTNEKIKIAYGEADELRNKLSQSGVKFNVDGTVSNYMESLQAQENYINSLIDKYNKMSAKQQESYKETIEQEKEKYEEFKKNIDRYDELISDFIPGLQQNVQDAIDKQIEINVQKFNLEIDVALDLREAQQQWLEFKKDILDDIADQNILGNMKYARETLNTVLNNTEVGGSLQTNTRHIQDIMREINIMRNGSKSSVYGDNEDKALEDLRNYMNESETDLTTIKEMADAIKDSWLQGAEQAKEAFDDQITQLQIIDSILEHQLNMLELAYGDNAYVEQEKLYQEKINSIDAQIGFQRDEAAFWAAQLEDAKAELAKTDKDSADYYRYQELVNNFRDNLEEAMNELEASYEAKMDAITNAYIAHIEKVFKALEKGLTNNVGFDWANEQWDLMNKNSEEYLDNINAMYKVQELSNKYNDAINQSNNVKIQQKLASLRDSEMDALREKDKLSEYDLKRADLRYQIALKQIALEEAQQNKSTMRLKRDSQGNYSYVYTADEDKIASIREEVSNLYNELYNLDLDKYKENLEKVNEYTAEWIEKYKEISEDKTLTDEEREARWYDLEVYYGDLINSLAEDNAYIRDNLYQSSMAELFDLYNQNTDNYEAMTDEQKAMVEQFMDDTKDYTRAAYDTVFEIYNENLEKFYDMTAEQKEMLMNELVPAWESTYQTLIDTVTGEGGFIQAMKTATDDIKASAEIYFKTLKDNYDIANKDADTYKTLVHGITTENETVINQYEQLIADIRKDQKDWEAWEGIWSKALEDSKQTLKNAQDLTKEILKQNELEYRNQENPETHVDGSAQSETQPSTNTGNNTPAASQPVAPSLAKGAYVQVKSGTKWYTDSYGGGTSGYAHAGTIKYINERGSHAYNIDGLGWIRKTDIVGYATGGYTGDWTGQDGRLAMLHQKEMVLNAEDTRNMLDAVKIIRDITNSMNMTLLSRLVNISANGGINTTSEPLEQNVHIEANFPNVTSQNEIENAINNLVNMASQRVSTK